MHCRGCDFSGDAIELYQKISRAPTLDEAIRQARRDGLCEGRGRDISHYEIEKYVEAYPSFRGKVKDIWNELSKTALESPSTELIRHAQNKHLWSGWMMGAHKRMTRFLGGGDGKEVSKLLSDQFGRRILPRKGYHTLMAVSYQDAPGRICSMNFIGEEATFYTPLSPFKSKTHEGGLSMLDTLDGIEKTVFATGALGTALQLQRTNFTSRHEPLKLVVYCDDTVNAWRSVNAERVIFWNPIIDWSLFKQVKRLENGWISDRPKLRSEDPFHYDRRHSLEVIFGTMEAHAKPWPRFMAEWLTDPERKLSESVGTVRSADLDAGDREKILSACPDDRLEVLKRIFSEDPLSSIQPVTFHNQVLIEREDGWYQVTSVGESLITDATTRVMTETNSDGAGEVFWTGEIKYQKHRILFSGEPFHKVEKNPIKWLREKTSSAGLGYPRFNHVWAKHFTNLVKTFHRPQVIQVSDRLGLNDEGVISFPNFAVCNGEIVPRSSNIFGPEDPAVNLNKPQPLTKGLKKPTTKADAVWAALCAAYVSTILTRKLPSATFVTGSHIGACVMGQFIPAAGMLSRDVIVASESEKESLLKAMNRFGYPLHLRIDKSALSKLPHKLYSRCFISTDWAAALAVCTHEPGLLIEDTFLDEDVAVPSFDEVLWYLADWQSRDPVQGQAPHPFVPIAHDFCRFVEEETGRWDATEVMEEVARIVRVPSPGDALLELMAHLCVIGVIATDYRDLTSKHSITRITRSERRPVLIDPDQRLVYIPRATIVRRCQSCDIPKPEFFRAEKDLGDRKKLSQGIASEGITLTLDVWEDTIRKVQTP